jgi:predicted amidohydrolase YtcJ
MEKDLGSLEAGKLADITVLDRNILRSDIDELRDVRVRLTIMDGSVVYED